MVANGKACGIEITTEMIETDSKVLLEAGLEDDRSRADRWLIPEIFASMFERRNHLVLPLMVA